MRERFVVLHDHWDRLAGDWVRGRVVCCDVASTIEVLRLLDTLGYCDHMRVRRSEIATYFHVHGAF